MALSEREWDYSKAKGIGNVLTSAERHRAFNGTARLAYSAANAIDVTTSLNVSRRLFGVSGGGEFLCDERRGIAAFGSRRWLTLSFTGMAPLRIEVYEVRIANGQCRCRFEVKS